MKFLRDVWTTFNHLFETALSTKPSSKIADAIKEFNAKLILAYQDDEKAYRSSKIRLNLAIVLTGLLLVSVTAAIFLISSAYFIFIFMASGFCSVMLGFLALKYLTYEPSSDLKKAIEQLQALIIETDKRHSRLIPSFRTPSHSRPMITGLASQISSWLGIPVHNVRLALIVAIPITGFLIIPIYFIASYFFIKR